MSLAVDVEIESMDMVVRRCMQALIDCGATGCFIDIEWAKLNNIPMCPLTNPIPVYNVDGTTNDAGMITDITDIILRYENHSERTQLAVTCLGKQSMILGYNWLRNHNPEINWIGIIIRQYLAMESLWERQWKVYEQGNGQAYEHNNDKIGEMGNVSSMFHIFGSMFFDVSIIDIDGF
jgi:hypothetical protein